jgi:hypothetical protein
VLGLDDLANVRHRNAVMDAANALNLKEHDVWVPYLPWCLSRAVPRPSCRFHVHITLAVAALARVVEPFALMSLLLSLLCPHVSWGADKFSSLQGGLPGSCSMSSSVLMYCELTHPPPTPPPPPPPYPLVSSHTAAPAVRPVSCGKRIQFAGDVEGHVGTSDARFYLLDLQRCFPPVEPSLTCSGELVPTGITAPSKTIEELGALDGTKGVPAAASWKTVGVDLCWRGGVGEDGEGGRGICRTALAACVCCAVPWCACMGSSPPSEQCLLLFSGHHHCSMDALPSRARTWGHSWLQSHTRCPCGAYLSPCTMATVPLPTRRARCRRLSYGGCCWLLLLLLLLRGGRAGGGHCSQCPGASCTSTRRRTLPAVLARVWQTGPRVCAGCARGGGLGGQRAHVPGGGAGGARCCRVRHVLWQWTGGAVRTAAARCVCVCVCGGGGVCLVNPVAPHVASPRPPSPRTNGKRSISNYEIKCDNERCHPSVWCAPLPPLLPNSHLE